MRDFEQSIIINEKIKLEERFEFRTIFSEEAVQAASVERVCFPPNEACTEEMMKRTKNGKALYLHCLPADITGLSCPEGEVDNSVFDRYLVPLYKEASYKPTSSRP